MQVKLKKAANEKFQSGTSVTAMWFKQSASTFYPHSVGGHISIRRHSFQDQRIHLITRHRAHFWPSRVALRYSSVLPDTQVGCNQCGSGLPQICLGNGKQIRRDPRCISHRFCKDLDRKDLSRSHKAGLDTNKQNTTTKNKTTE